MPRAQLTEDQVADFQLRAVEAATRLFAEHGYEAFTMRAVAKELGCSPMTPYRYFDNKEELFAHVRTEAFRRFADRQERAFANGAPLLERIEDLRKAYVRFALDEPDAYRIMFELRQTPPVEFPELAAQSRRAFSYLHRTVVELCASGAMPGDPLTQAHLLWAGVHGIVSLHLAGQLVMGRSLQELACTPWHEEPPR